MCRSCFAHFLGSDNGDEDREFNQILADIERTLHIRALLSEKVTTRTLESIADVQARLDQQSWDANLERMLHELVDLPPLLLPEFATVNTLLDLQQKYADSISDLRTSIKDGATNSKILRLVRTCDEVKGDFIRAFGNNLTTPGSTIDNVRNMLGTFTCRALTCSHLSASSSSVIDVCVRWLLGAR